MRIMSAHTFQFWIGALVAMIVMLILIWIAIYLEIIIPNV